MAKGGKKSVKITGGSFVGKTNVVAGTLVDHGPGVQVTRLDDLRATLELRKDELVRAGGGESEKVRRRLDRLGGELAEDEPDAGAVRKGWKAVTTLLAGAAGAAESIKKITELVHAVFP